MSDSASTAWNAGPHTGPWDNGAHRRCGRKPGRGLEIVGIILGFIFVWPLADELHQLERFREDVVPLVSHT